MKQIFLLHDLKKMDEQNPYWPDPSIMIVGASGKAGRCMGCFGCWLKTPGKCVIMDGFERVGYELVDSREVIIISRNEYGGFSGKIKQILDRSISSLLPFFAEKEGRMSHIPRYPFLPRFRVFFYDCTELTAQEEALADEIVAASAEAFHAQSWETTFLEGIPAIEEVLSR